MQRRPRRIAGFVTTVVLLGVLLLVVTHRNQIYDWQKLRGYTPPASVAKLAADTTMTPYTQHLFYVNHPEIQDKTEFNQNCPNGGGEQTIILGCYRDHQTGIFVYAVSDPQLSGIQQVTAAHEALHAVYDRLSPKERAYVDGLLQDYFTNGLHDKRIIDTIAAYKKSEPNDLVNEMHSIFGTEVADLPPVLESYYRKYFINRKRVVAFAAQYQQAFTGRETQIAQYDAQLQSMKQQIEQKQADLSNQAQVLNSTRSQVENGNDSVQIGAYNQKVRIYNNELTATNALIDRFNAILDKRNALAVEEQQLYKAINSNLQPQSAQ